MSAPMTGEGARRSSVSQVGVQGTDANLGIVTD